MSHKIILPEVPEDKPGDFRIRLLNLMQMVVFAEPTTLTANATLQLMPSVLLCDATAGNITVSLLPAANCKGVTYFIKKIDASANTVTINADGNETIDGALTQVLVARWASITIVCDGAAWYILCD